MKDKGKLPWELKGRIVEEYRGGRSGVTGITQKHGINDNLAGLQ
jgi:transposase-like protein